MQQLKKLNCGLIEGKFVNSRVHIGLFMRNLLGGCLPYVETPGLILGFPPHHSTHGFSLHPKLQDGHSIHLQPLMVRIHRNPLERQRIVHELRSWPAKNEPAKYPVFIVLPMADTCTVRWRKHKKTAVKSLNATHKNWTFADFANTFTYESMYVCTYACMYIRTYVMHVMYLMYATYGMH